MDKARSVYRRANDRLRAGDEKEERLMVLEAWHQFEVDLVHLFCQ